VERTQVIEPSPAVHGGGQTASHAFSYIAQKTENIQQIGFSGSVRPQNVRHIAKRNVEFPEVPPVFQPKSAYQHEYLSL